MFIVVLFFAGMSSHATAQSNGPMVVSVAGFRSTEGQIMAFLFSNADDFPTKRDKALRSRKTAVMGTTTIFVFDDVPAGVYGVAVYHDENSNGKMDRHWYGTPMEGYGASNDATGSFGPPKFADAKFEFHSSRDTVRIQLHY